MLWMLLTNVFGSAWAQSHLALVKPADADEWGYIDTKGAFVIKPQFRKAESFSEGYGAIYEKAEKSFFFLDSKGQRLPVNLKSYALKTVLGFGAMGFEDGRAPIQVSKKWGFLGSDGKVAVQPKYDWVSRYSGGFTSARLDGKFYVLDKGGAETAVDLPGMLEMRHFDDGLAPVKASDKTWGYVDSKGKVAIQPKFKSVGHFVNGVAWATVIENDETRAGYIDKKGDWVIEPVYAMAKEFDADSGLARVKKDDTWTFVKRDGTELAAADAESFDDYHEGFSKAKKGGLHGFLDTKQAWAIEPQFDNVRDFHNGYAAARKGELWGFIDTKGAWAIEPTFDSVKDFEDATP